MISVYKYSLYLLFVSLDKYPSIPLLADICRCYSTCGLDPFPTKLLMSHLSSIINIILRIVNLCFSSGDFPFRFNGGICFIKENSTKKNT